jgi:RND family efflux transporter MFP subunit
MNTKTALRVAALGLAALLAGCDSGKESAPLARPVETVIVRSGALSEAAAFTGDVRARHESDLAFRIGGKVIERRVDVGAAVRKGQVLARIDPADAALQASQAEAQRALAESETQRFRDLRARNFVSQAALDARETALKTAAAQAAVARNQAGYTVLVADRDGVVTAVMAEPGQVVGAGQPVLRFARPEEKEVLVNVSESRVKDVRAAADALVTLWAHPARRYAGRVREIAPAADAATRTFAVRAMPTCAWA